MNGTMYRVLVVCGLACVLASCAAAPTKRTSVEVEVIASSTANADASGRPSPVVVYVLSLRSIDRLQPVSINELIDGPAAALGSDLISFRQVTVLPSEVKRLEIDVSPDTRFIAVAGAIQAYQSRQWKDFVEYRSGIISGITGRQDVRAEVGDAGVRILRDK